MWAGLIRSGMPMRLRDRSKDSSVRTPYPSGSPVMSCSCCGGAGSAVRPLRTEVAEIVLADEGPADLERGRPRQLVDHPDRDRALVPSQPAREILHELLFGGRADECHRYGGHLSQPRVGQPDG